MSAWVALSWELFARHRRVFGAMAAWFVLICVVCPLLPEAWRRPDLIPYLALPCLGLPLIFATLAHGHAARLEARASAFPSRLFTLPAPARTLAGVPLAMGTLLSACWPAFALCVLRPCGVEAALFWPMALIAAFVAWAQALSWVPLPLWWLRMGLLVLALPGLCVTALFLSVAAGDEVWSAALLGAAVPVAYAVAIRGVARARHGVGTDEPHVETAAVERVRLAPFATAEAARGWLEWRRQGWLSMVVLAGALAWGLLSTQLSEWVLRQRGVVEEVPWLTWPAEAFGVGWLSLSQLLLAPVIMSLGGADVGRLSSWRGIRPSTFFLTQAVTTSWVVRGKLLLGAKLTALTWAGVLGVGTAWAAIRGHLPDMTDRLVSNTGSWPAALGVLAGGLLLAAALTWLWLVGGLWGGLLGRKALAPAPLAVGFASWFAAGAAVYWWSADPRTRPLIVACLALLLAAKAAATAWAVRRLLARRLTTAATAAGCVLAWAALAVVVGSLACRLSGGGAAPFAGVLLLMPLARALAGPLALDAARHR